MFNHIASIEPWTTELQSIMHTLLELPLMGLAPLRTDAKVFEIQAYIGLDKKAHRTLLVRLCITIQDFVDRR